MANSFRPGVNVHCLTAQKTHEGLSAFPREIHRQARRRRNRAHHGNPRRQRFLQDLERCPPADEQDVRFERQLVLQKSEAQHLVHRVVAANVLAQHDQFAFRIEQGRRMQPAGLGEGCLRPRACAAGKRVTTFAATVSFDFTGGKC